MSRTTNNPASPRLPLADALEGCLLGTAAGDMLGLPFENLSRAQVARVCVLPLEPSLFLGRGLVSDDTEHTAMLARSLLEAFDDPRRFARRFAARLRWWLLSAPPGVGGATARGILKLWIGFPPARSGVRSAGNGPSMRAALLGVVFGDEPAKLAAFLVASVALTHRDERAHAGALVVACAAACSRERRDGDPAAALTALLARIAEVRGPAPDALTSTLQAMPSALARGLDVGAYARELGCERGVTGFVMHTVPVAVYAWLVHARDLRQAITEVVLCGGDTDSVAAITGAIIGAGTGADAIPPSWLARTLEIPGTIARLRGVARDLAAALAAGQPRRASLRAVVAESAWWPVMLVRNLAMFVLIVGVLVRRSVQVAIRR